MLPNRVVKSRGKYTPRACVLCRKRKLKCCGNDPCARCTRHGVACIFSDDPSIEVPNTRRGSALVEEFALRYGKSDSPSGIETRVRSMEATIQALARLIPESGAAETEPQPDESGFQGETAFQSLVNTVNASITSLRAQIGPEDEPASVAPQNHSPQSMEADGGRKAYTTVRFGARDMPFPEPADFMRYLEFIFRDINACHPCLNEADFTSKTHKMLETHIVQPCDASLLATNYILLALTDILTDTSPVQGRKSLPGWQWYLAADEIMGRRKLSGRADLALIQFLICETLYLIHADKPNAAYNVSGLACRLCFQLGLNQQELWGQDCQPFQVHMRQRVFWTVYSLDRRVSLSCGKPFGIRDSDHRVDEPAWIDDQSLHPDQDLPPPDPDNSCNVYLSCLIAFARFAGEIWDQGFSASSTRSPLPGEKTAILDARIKYWVDTQFAAIPLLSTQSTPTKRQLWQDTLIRTRMNQLRILLRRRTMASLAYTRQDGLICGQLATEIIQDLHAHATEAQKPSSLRFHMAIALGDAILILATLLCRDLTSLDLNLHEMRALYLESYRRGVSMLRDIAVSLHTAGRILQDLRHVVGVVEHLHGGLRGSPQPMDFADSVPPNPGELFQYGFENLNAGFLPSPFLPEWVGAGLEQTGTSVGDDLFIGGASGGYDDSLFALQGGHGISWV